MNTSTLQLDRYELIYLLWRMKTLSLPGIGSKPFGGQFGYKVMARLATAKQSLQTRGLIWIQETEVRINQHALTLVGTCALAKASLMMESQSKDTTPKTLYFHFRSRQWVRHSMLERGMHNFDLVESPLPDFISLIGIIPLQDHSSNPIEFTLPKAIVDLVLALFSNQQLPEAHNMLGGICLPADLARVLIDTLSDMQQKILLGVTLRNNTENQEGEAVVLIRNTQGLWRVKNPVGNGSVRLTSVSHQEITDLFNSIAQQAQVP